MNSEPQKKSHHQGGNPMRQQSRILPLVGLLIVVASPSIAQPTTTTPFDPSSITANTTVNGLLEGMNARLRMPGNTLPGVPPTGTVITRLKGYVGPSTAETVKLYWDLSLSRYWEIPRSAILSQVPGNGPNDPVTILVPSVTPIITANSMPATNVVMQRALIDGLGNISLEGPGLGPGRPLPGQPTVISSAGLDFLKGAGKGAAFACLGGVPVACDVAFGVGLGSLLVQ
jgi:hypothetical protein